MKTCRECGVSGSEDLFVSRANLCKECNRAYMKAYRKTHEDQAVAKYDPDKLKTCSKCGFEGKATLFRKGRNVCKKCRDVYQEKYAEDHKEDISAQRKSRYNEHQEELVEFQRKYRIDNKEIIAERAKEKYDADPTHKLDINRKYATSPKGREASKRKFNKRRDLGYVPINKWFTDADFHHVHLNGDTGIGLFIPIELHRSIQHNGTTGEGMPEINKAAFLWLCEQSVI